MLLRGGGFDAAILDVMLPEMDGFELCRTIRRESKLPIVMATARSDVMDRVVDLELGAGDDLPRPFKPREPVARLQTVLRRRRPADAAAGAWRPISWLAWPRPSTAPTARARVPPPASVR